MLLFKRAYWDGLTSGAITLTFRRWQRAHVKVGGRYRCHPIGVLEVDAVTVVTAPKITPQDAKRAGFLSVDALLGYLTELGPLDDDSPLYRIELHHGGDGDRVPLALVDRLDAADVESIGAALSRLDKQAPWSCRTLALIDAFPRVAASELAARAGRKTASFKADVCKLKKLGLTQSFEVGYELAPRGRAYVDAASLARRP